MNNSLFPCVTYWWDKWARVWTIQHKDAQGNQVGDANHVWGAKLAEMEAISLAQALNLPVRKNA